MPHRQNKKKHINSTVTWTTTSTSNNTQSITSDVVTFDWSGYTRMFRWAISTLGEDDDTITVS